MRRFFARSSLILVACMLFLAVIRDVGHARLSDFRLLFTFPDGSPCPQPCLFGIHPGETSYDEALTLLSTHPLTTQGAIYTNPALKNVSNWNDGTLFLELSQGDPKDPQRVTRLDLHLVMLDSSGVVIPPTGARIDSTLGDVVAEFGEPTYTRPTTSEFGFVTWTYFDAVGLQVMTSQRQLDRLRLEDSIEMLNMQMPPFNIRQEMKGWVGFTVTRRYEDVGDFAR